MCVYSTDVNEPRRAAVNAKRKLDEVTHPKEQSPPKRTKRAKLLSEAEKLDSVSSLLEQVPKCEQRAEPIEPKERKYCLECLDGGRLKECDSCSEPWHRDCVEKKCFEYSFDGETFKCPVCRGNRNSDQKGLKVIAAIHRRTDSDVPYGQGMTWIVRQPGLVRNTQLSDERMKEEGFMTRIHWLSQYEPHETN